jgi:adenine-specific DNA glycosylase
MPAESLEKIRQGRLGSKHSKATKNQISESAKNDPLYLQRPDRRCQKPKKEKKAWNWILAWEKMDEETKRKFTKFKKEMGMNVKIKESLGTFKQTYSHFKLALHVFNCESIDGKGRADKKDRRS